jgi:hypothetical protein
MLGFKVSCHLVDHCFCVRPGTSAATAPQFLPPCTCTESFSLVSSSSAHLPYVQPSRRCWDSKNHAICSNTVFAYDLEPVRQLRPNPCHCAFYSILQLAVFVFYSFILAFIRPVDAGIQDRQLQPQSVLYSLVCFFLAVFAIALVKCVSSSVVQ